MISQNQYFTILDAVESTNNYAMAKLHAGLAVHGQAWFARHQWGGKGQRDNKWFSKKDENITMTVTLKPNRVFKNNMFLFNAVVACTCHQFFSAYAGSATFLKWPNDIYYNDRKAGGLLIENIFTGQDWTWAAVGIGINVNQTDFDDENTSATSLQTICNQIFDPIVLGKKLHAALLENFEHVDALSEDSYFNYYNEHLYKRGEIVRLKKDNAIFSTCIKKVNKKGQLITLDVLERVFNTGEIKWIV